jgi:hypothetical protein
MFYDWLPPSGAVVTTGQGSAIATIRFDNEIPNNSILSVKAVNLCGISAARTLSLSPDIPANPGAITGPISACAGQQYTYSIAAVSGAVGYLWSIPSGSSFISGNFTRSITIQMGSSSGNVAVLPYGRCNFAAANKVKQVTVTSCFRTAKDPQYVYDKMELFPNPLPHNRKFSLRFTAPVAALYNIQLIDVSEKVLMTRSYLAYKGINIVEIDPGELASGTYLVALKGKDRYEVKKLLVK